MACRTGLAHQPCFDKLSTRLSVLLAESRGLSPSLSKDSRTHQPWFDKLTTGLERRGGWCRNHVTHK